MGNAATDAALDSWIPLIPAEFLAEQPRSVRFCLEQANECARHQLWVPASLMLRKALEIAVNLKLKQLGREGEIYDDNDEERSLSARLAVLERDVRAVRRDIRDILIIKWFGDRGAHSRMDLYENDIRAIVAPRLRALLTHLELQS